MLSKVKFALLIFMSTFISAEVSNAEVKVVIKNDIYGFILAISGRLSDDKIKQKFEEWKNALINLLKNLLEENQEPKYKDLKESINKVSKANKPDSIFQNELDNKLHEFFLKFFEKKYKDLDSEIETIKRNENQLKKEKIDPYQIILNEDMNKQKITILAIQKGDNLECINSLRENINFFSKGCSSVNDVLLIRRLKESDKIFREITELTKESKEKYDLALEDLHNSFPLDPSQLSRFPDPVAVCVSSSIVLFDNPNQKYEDTIYLTGVRAGVRAFFYNALQFWESEKNIYISSVKAPVKDNKHQIDDPCGTMILIKLKLATTATNFIKPELKEIILLDSPKYLSYPAFPELSDKNDKEMEKRVSELNDESWAKINLAIKNLCENILQVCVEWKNQLDSETKAKENAKTILEGVESALKKKAEEKSEIKRNLITNEFLKTLASKIRKFIDEKKLSTSPKS